MAILQFNNQTTGTNPSLHDQKITDTKFPTKSQHNPSGSYKLIHISFYQIQETTSRDTEIFF